MDSVDVLIIGGGACGLMAAVELAGAGKKVKILEARIRLGGRIYTQTGNGFSIPTEAGAEFIHGNLPLTQQLLKAAGMPVQDMAGKSYQVLNGEVKQPDAFIENFDILLQKLNSLPEDIPFSQFLEEHLNEEHLAGMRQSVTRFAEGYDAADITKASTFALRDEWQTDGATNSYFPIGGYGQLIRFLADQCQAAGAEFCLAAIVKEISWAAGRVEVLTAAGVINQASQIIVTVPLGVLQSEPGALGYIQFSPELPVHRKAFQALGFGPVIKIILEFKTPFWEEPAVAGARQMPELGFLFTDASPISAWWTRLPDPTPVLTGWLAGPAAHQHRNATPEDLLALALNTLADLFTVDPVFLRGHLVANQVVNWLQDPYSRGAYAYATVASATARKVAAEPVKNTLYFAGEALYLGPAMGTVEAALASGRDTARLLLGLPA